MAINGNNIIITVDGHAVAGTRSNEIKCESEIIEISSSSNQSWKTVIAGRRSWSFSVGFLVLANSRVRQLISVGSKYSVIIKERNASSSEQVSGEAIMKTCTIQATRGNLATGSFSFTGTGPLT